MSAALVIGKFYPPHRGHVRLLEFALVHREIVVVLCAGSTTDSLPPESRLDALFEDAKSAGIDSTQLIGRAAYDETPFDTDDPSVWASHVKVFEAMLEGLPSVDIVVTSEGYGEELASRMGLIHVDFDSHRKLVPLSSTEIRENPLDHWDALGPGTKRMLAARVVILGAESTGTTTISERLTDALHRRGQPWSLVRMVKEYGRELTEQKQRAVEGTTGRAPLSVQWDVNDFKHVSVQQHEMEEAAAASGGPVVVCDTDALATTVWERRYLGDSYAELDPTTLGMGDVYLLTHHEGVPFVQDGTRDGEHVRASMTQQFASLLVQHQRPFAVLTGTLEDRLNLALRITDQTVARKVSFREPI